LISIEKKKNVILAHGTKVSCDEILAKENLSKYNAVFLPGGPGYVRFNKEFAPKLVAFAQKEHKNPKINFLAICAAPLCFADWDVLDAGVKVTCYPSLVNAKIEDNYVKQDLVVSKNFITAAGPGIASDFAFKVVEEFIDAAKVKDLQKEMLF
jgi:putative intracellular protease/amidase